MATPTKLMTFAEFERLPDREGFRMELHHGQLVYVPPAKNPHFTVQQVIRDLLDRYAGTSGRAYTEAGFRPVPEFEFIVADVAYTTHERWNQFRKAPYFLGAPDLVVEVLSPSNKRGKMVDKQALCLENGALQFWLVDIDLREVKVSAREGKTLTYREGPAIPLAVSGRDISVDAIFAPLAN